LANEFVYKVYLLQEESYEDYVNKTSQKPKWIP
jgi:hypothetical protein